MTFFGPVPLFVSIFKKVTTDDSWQLWRVFRDDCNNVSMCSQLKRYVNYSVVCIACKSHTELQLLRNMTISPRPDVETWGIIARINELKYLQQNWGDIVGLYITEE